MQVSLHSNVSLIHSSLFFRKMCSLDPLKTELSLIFTKQWFQWLTFDFYKCVFGDLQIAFDYDVYLFLWRLKCLFFFSVSLNGNLSLTLTKNVSLRLNCLILTPKNLSLVACALGFDVYVDKKTKLSLRFTKEDLLVFELSGKKKKPTLQARVYKRASASLLSGIKGINQGRPPRYWTPCIIAIVAAKSASSTGKNCPESARKWVMRLIPCKRARLIMRQAGERSY